MTRELRDELQDALGAAYTIDRELGGGGMSRVFVAHETSLGRDVVVKVLPPDLAGELSAERFRREIQLAARLQHPHIVPVLSAGSAGSILFYTMPFIEGDTLRGQLQRSGELRMQEVIRTSREIADALAYAHESGVVHRDLKPENILVTRGHALVADFGVAKAVTESVTASGNTRSVLTSVGLALGTPAYMAPEQAAGDPGVDHRADLYALGCVMYELLTGSPPFSGRPTQSLLAAHIAELPDPVSRRRPATPQALASLVMSMLEKRPADRPRSADDVVAALDAIGTGETISAAMIASQPVASSGRGRMGWRIGIAAGVVAGVALVAVVATNLASRREAPADSSGPVPIAIVHDDSNGSSDALQAAENSIRDYLTDGIATFDGARVVDDAKSARFVIATSVATLGRDSLLLRARLVDAASGKVLRAFTPARAGVVDPTSALSELRGRAHAAIGIVIHPMLGPAALPGSDSPTADAFTEFSAALVDIDRILSGSSLDRSKTVALLDKATALDSNFVQPRLWRAFVGATTLRARAPSDTLVIDVLNAHSGQMTPYERDLAALFHASLTGDVATSVRTSERIYKATPAEWTAQAYARALIQVARYKRSAAILDSLSDKATADDPQFWADYVRALHMMGEHRRELIAARRAVELMPERKGVRNFEITALIALDSGETAMRRMEDALLLPVETDAANSSLSMFSSAAGEFRSHGRPDYALRVEKRAAPLVDQERAAGSAQIGTWLVSLRQYDFAVELGRKSAARDSTNFGPAALLGVASAMKGDTATALRQIERIKEAASHFGQYTNGADFTARARIAAALGRDNEAIALVSQALAHGQGLNMRRQVHWGIEFDRLRNNPEIKKMLKPRDD
jgi:serine/threonine protein kinase/tetratricopeptide (TPR) repeat protein